MIYPFSCPSCGNYQEEVRHHSEASNICECKVCGHVMDRVYTKPQVSIPDTGYYDNGLGCVVNSKRDKADAIKRINDNTGARLVETGLERVKTKPKMHDYSIPRGLFDNAIIDN